MNTVKLTIPVLTLLEVIQKENAQLADVLSQKLHNSQQITIQFMLPIALHTDTVPVCDTPFEPICFDPGESWLDRICR